MKNHLKKITIASLSACFLLSLLNCGGESPPDEDPGSDESTYSITVTGTELLNQRFDSSGYLIAYFIPDSLSGTLLEKINTTPYQASPGFIAKGEDFSVKIEDIPSDLKGEVIVVAEAAASEDLIAEVGDHVSELATVDSATSFVTNLDLYKLLTEEPYGSYAVSGGIITLFDDGHKRGNLYLVCIDDTAIASTNITDQEVIDAINANQIIFLEADVGAGGGFSYSVSFNNELDQMWLSTYVDVNNDGLNAGDIISDVRQFINFFDDNRNDVNLNANKSITP